MWIGPQDFNSTLKGYSDPLLCFIKFNFVLKTTTANQQNCESLFFALKKVASNVMSIVSDQSTEKRSENLTRKKDEKSCMKKISRALQGIMDKGRNTPDKIQTSRAKKQALSWSKLASKKGIMVLWSNASCIRSGISPPPTLFKWTTIWRAKRRRRMETKNH